MKKSETEIPKKVALYLRVSTSEQTNENQRIRLVEYAKAKKIKYDVFEEKESTRKTRPVKQQLLMMLRKGEYQSVIVYKLDRWARSSTELILEVKELMDKGIGFISISDNLDFTCASGMLHFQLLSIFSEFERALISERTREGLRRTKMQGTQLGRPKGSKDSSKRPRSGYIMREANKRKSKDEKNGVYKVIEEYIQ